MALGDSISTDDYPGEGKGAASLFYRNQDHLYPDFKGLDLATLFSGIEFQLQALDGATSSHVIHEQIPQIKHIRRSRVVFTLTAGGNDILSEQDDADHISLRIQTITRTLKQLFPACIIILGTIYDPSDGAGDLFEPGVRLHREMETLATLNQNIREMAAPGIEVVDIYKHFLGHGSRAKDPSNPFHHSEDPSLWYLLTIEPNTRGAHEIRKLFWNRLRGILDRKT